MQFSSDAEIRKIPQLVEDFFRQVLYDEEPIFVGDEATILDVSMAMPDELVKRCEAYYGRPVTVQDLRRPLWQFLGEFGASLDNSAR